MNNIALWFARDEGENIILINDVNDSNKLNYYRCPICGSQVIPKAISNKSKTSSHFAHIDKSKCNGESMVHFWFKHKLIQPNDNFSIVFNGSKLDFVCEDLMVEEKYETPFGVYTPDLTVKVKGGDIVFFEFNYSNKKDISEYIDIWGHINAPVVEIDIKKIMNVNSTNMEFNAIYLNGEHKPKKHNSSYYNTIGKFKLQNKDNYNAVRDEIVKLEWFWKEVYRYQNNEIDFNSIYIIYSMTKNIRNSFVLDSIIKKSRCSKFREDLRKFKDSRVIFRHEDSRMEDYGGILQLSKDIAYLDNKFQNSKTNFRVELKQKSNTKYETYYHGSRKHPYKSRPCGVYYTYSVVLKRNGRTIYKEDITNKNVNSENSKKMLIKRIFLKIDESLRKSKDKCVTCGGKLNLSIVDFVFSINRDFKVTKRCSACRANRRNNG